MATSFTLNMLAEKANDKSPQAAQLSSSHSTRPGSPMDIDASEARHSREGSHLLVFSFRPLILNLDCGMIVNRSERRAHRLSPLVPTVTQFNVPAW